MGAHIETDGDAVRIGPVPGAASAGHATMIPDRCRRPAHRHARRGAPRRATAGLVVLALAFIAASCACAQSPPTNLQAEPGYQQVTLTWDAPAVLGTDRTLKRYEYWYSGVDKTGVPVLVSANHDKTESAVVTGLDNGQQYTFNVRARLDNDAVSPHATVEATPGAAPREPLNLRATPGDGQVTLAWDAPFDLGGFAIERYQYQVYRREGDGVWRSTNLSRQATVTGLLNGRTYSFDVQAVNERGASLAVTTSATPGSAPTAPRDLKASPGNREVTLTWQEPAYNGGFSVTRYEYRTDGTGDWTSVVLAREVTLLTDGTGTRLTNGRRYGFEVRAVNDRGESEAAAVSATPATKPSAPRMLEATPGDRLVALTWLAPENNGGAAIIRYEYRVDGSGDWNDAGTALETIATEGLVNGRQHTFAVRAVNTQGESGEATVMATPVGTPSPPLMLEATLGDREVMLTWLAPEDNGGADIIRYEYRVDGEGGWIETDSTSQTTAGNLANGRPYGFEVRAVNERDEGEGEAATVTATPATTPSAPLVLEATPGDGEVMLTWLEPENNGGAAIERYEYRVDGRGDWIGTELNRQVTVTGLTNGQAYEFEVRAVNAQGEGDATATVMETPAETPSAPLMLEAMPGNGEVTLTWGAPSSTGGSDLTRYEYRIDGRGDWIGTEMKLQITVTGLTNGRRYGFEVRAVNAHGAGETAAVTATPALTPSAPRDLAATPGDGEVTLSWIAPSSDGGPSITGYEYRYRIGHEGSWADWLDNGTNRRVTVTGLTSGRPYGFEVRAVNPHGAGEAAAVTATPALTPPAPLDLTATPGDAEVRLAWEAPSSDGGAPIERYEYRIDGREWIGTRLNRWVTVTGLTNGQEYEFEVRAVNARGAGEAAAVTATPALTPPAPRNLRAAPGSGKVTLTWDAPESGGGLAIERYEYRVDRSGRWTRTTRVPTALAREVTVTGLTNGQEYEFEVRAVNAHGPGEAAAVTATPAPTPSALLDLTATPGDAEVTLTWEAPESGGGLAIERYEYRVDRSGDWMSVAALAREVTVRGLINGRPYTFEVRAVNEQGEGKAATVTATPALTPSVPRDLTAESGDGRVTLAWEAPESDGGLAIERYEYRVDRSGDWTSVALAREVPVTGLDNGRSYTFEVRAVNERGEGEAEEARATPALTPSAPRDLTATPGDGRVTLAWEAPGSDGGLAIERYEYRVDRSGDWTSVALAREVPVTGLDNGRSYTFEVRAVNERGEGKAAEVTATPALTPSAPRNLRAAPGSGEVTLTWDAPGSGGGLAIERYEYRVDRSGDWTRVALAREVMVTELDNGRPYVFEVRAVNAHGEGEAAAVIAAPALTPSALLDLTATPGDGEVTLTWEAPKNDGGAVIVGYQHRYRTEVGEAWTDWSRTGTNRRVSVIDLTNGERYVFEVRAVNAQGAGEAVGVMETPVTTPSAPRDLRAEQGDGEVTLTWLEPENNGGAAIERYEYRVGTSGEWTGTELALRVTVGDLANGRSYTFEVRAVNERGEGEAARVTVTPAPGPPGTPTGLTANAEDSSKIVLDWKAPSSGRAAVTGYRVEVSADGGVNWEVLVANTADRNPTYTHTGLHGGTTRHYRVSAVSSSGAGPSSDVARATTPPGRPAAPRNLRAAPGDEQAMLTWDAPSSDGGAAIERYEYRVDGGMVWTGTGTELETMVSDLTNGEEYTFEVRAVNGQGAGPAVKTRVTVGRTDRVTGAWLGGFASTVAGHVLGGVRERLATPGSAGARARFAGRSIESGWEPGDGAFALSGRWSARGGGLAGVWGSGVYSGFERGGALSLDGGARTATLGADYGNGRWTAGVAVAHSRGDATYAGSDGRGEVESVLTGVYPYAGYAVTGRMSAWVTGGYGLGTLTLAPEGDAAAREADIDLAMAAAGTRHRVLTAVETDGVALALETEGMWLHTASDAAPGLTPSEAGVTRVRLGLEGSYALKLQGRSTFTPSAAVAVRRDAGDAHTGLGAEVGGGVAYAGGSGALSAELSGRMLVVHQDSDFRDWGVSGSLVFDRRPGSARGLSLAVRPRVGTASVRGEGALLGGETLAEVGRGGGVGAPDARVEAELAYGWPAFGGRFIATPHAGLGVSGAGRDYVFGWRFESARRGVRPRVKLAVAVRRAHGAGDAPRDRVGLGLNLHW